MKVELLSTDGTDRRIAERARLSYDRDDDRGFEGLIRYLIEHRHSGPLEFCSMQFEVTASLAVVRQLTRHRTFSFNELSMRYVAPPETHHRPTSFRVPGGSSKQGSEEGDIDNEPYVDFLYNSTINASNQAYRKLIEHKVCREQARLVIPMAQHTRIVFAADLHNIMHYLQLRLADDAQSEHRAVAEEIARHVKEAFPIAWEAFEEFRLNAVTFCAAEMGHLRAGTRPDTILGSERRAKVFKEKLK